jgi:Chlorophyll A-B binding protein
VKGKQGSPPQSHIFDCCQSFKMKLAVFASLIAGAAAFAPAQTGKASTALKMSYENELGVIAPTGFFDPLGLSTNIDQETFNQYRTAELKHGRVAQLAVIGYIVPEIFRWPGEIAPGLAFADIPNGVAAIDAIPALGWAQMFFLIGAVDYYGFLGDFAAGKPDLPADELEKRQLNELQHGRLAMLAILELLRHDSQNLVSPGFDGLDNLITGLPFLYN